MKLSNGKAKHSTMPTNRSTQKCYFVFTGSYASATAPNDATYSHAAFGCNTIYEPVNSEVCERAS